MIDNLSKKCLELKFQSNHSIKSKCLKWIVKKEKKSARLQKNEKHTIREKSNCILCRSNKSRFLKQKNNNKKLFNVSQTDVIK